MVFDQALDGVPRNPGVVLWGIVCNRFHVFSGVQPLYNLLQGAVSVGSAWARKGLLQWSIAVKLSAPTGAGERGKSLRFPNCAIWKSEGMTLAMWTLIFFKAAAG